MTQEDWKIRAEELKIELDRGGFKGADEYYDVKDAYWRAIAKSRNTTELNINPMNYWFGRQSN